MEQDLRASEPRLEDRWALARVRNLLVVLDVAVDEEDVVEVEDLLEIQMPRPCVRRRVRGRPDSSYFKPAGVKVRDLKEVVLEMAEFEALRLVDFKGFSQEEAAGKMEVSQATLSRILTGARGKVSDAVVNGKALRISG